MSHAHTHTWVPGLAGTVPRLGDELRAAQASGGTLLVILKGQRP